MSQLIDNLNAIYNEKQTKIKPENIKKGVQIFDILGTHENLDTTDATATAGDIAKDKTAYVNGEKITGTYTPEEIVFDENSKIAYTRLQYIESTGTQYINTGYKPNSNTGYEFEYTNFIDDGCLFGAYASNWANGSGLFTSGIEGPDVYYWFHYNGNWNTMIPSVFTKDATVKITKNNIIINETSSYDATSSSFSVNYPLYLFGGNIGGSLSSPVCVRVKKFVISENDVIKHNFIPVRSNINGEVGLFDEIGQKFYTNQGTGTFIAGPEILPKDTSDFEENYQRVEFIQSSAKQYIKTGVKPTSGVHSAWVDFEVVQVIASKEAWILGQWYNNGWRCGGAGSSDGTTMSFDSTRGFTYTSQTMQTRIQGFSSASTITAPYEMTLFGQMENGSVRYYDYGYFKLYGCKIWENGVLIRDYVPCYRKSDSKPGIYDLVNNKFSVNGSGYANDFIKGPDVTSDESAYVSNGLTHYFKLDGDLTEKIYDTKCIDCGVMFVPDITLMRSCCDTSNGYAIFDTEDLSRTTFTLSVLAKTYSTCTDVNHMLISIGGPNSSNDVETTADTACALKIANKALSVDFCHSALGSSINPVGDGKWHRYTITYDGQAIRLFDNTTQVAGQAKTLKININALGIIGNWLPSWDMHYKGVLANLLIYNRVLSETEIAYNCTQDGI